jgi:predicted YcjX-like family ATPase
MFDKLSQNAGDALTDEQAANMKDVYKNMAESDRKKVTKIVSDHVDAATVKKATDALANGDTQTLKALADSELSESEKETMKDLYKKYVLEHK